MATSDTRDILLVDDSPELLDIYAALLRGAGHVVTTAEHGADAIATLEARLDDGDGLPDLVLLDMEMPVMDGPATAQALRDHDDLAELTIIALTSHELPDEVADTLDAGCDAYIVKPVDPDQLLGELRLLLAST